MKQQGARINGKKYIKGVRRNVKRCFKCNKVLTTANRSGLCEKCWRIEHKEYLREYQKRYRQNNKKKIREYKRKYEQKRKEQRIKLKEEQENNKYF